MHQLMIEEIILRALSSSLLFEGFSRESILSALGEVNYKLVEFDAGDIYLLEGAPCRWADIVVRGSLSARMIGDSGKEVVMDVRKTGDLMAPAFIFSHQNRIPVTIEAREESLIFRMTPEDLLALMDRDSRIRLNFIRSISDISVFLAGKVRLLSLSSVRDKVVYLLHSEYKKQGNELLHLGRSRQQIADSFGIQKFSLIRCLNQLQAEGLVEVSGKDIRLLKADYFK